MAVSYCSSVFCMLGANLRNGTEAHTGGDVKMLTIRCRAERRLRQIWTHGATSRLRMCDWQC